MSVGVSGSGQDLSTELDRYVEAAREAGCPADQLRNLRRANLVLRPKQLLASAAARECDRPGGPTRVAYGGARGGGKSHWALAQVVADDCIRYPGLKFLYLRKVGKSGREAVQDLRREVLHSVPHEYKVQEGRLVLPNGSSVVLGHFKNENDVDQYLGLQYDGALIEEATQLSRSKLRSIGGSIRTSKPGWRPRQYLTTNPGGVGHGWFKEMFVLPLRDGAESDTRFVQATVYDNPFINAEYRAELESLDGWQRRAWLEGDWDLALGQFFSNWRETVHVRAIPEVPDHWRVWGSLDYGYAHYTVFYLWAADDDGNIFSVDEHAGREMVPEEHVAAIKPMLAGWGLAIEDLEAAVAGGDVFSRDRDGKSPADDYEAAGLKLTRADMDRVSGWAEMLRRLGSPRANPPRPPTWFVGDRCKRLIESMPLMIHDPNRGEDVLKVDCDEDGRGGDDAPDSARYGVKYAWRKPARWGGSPFPSDRDRD